tara:strand:+ start:3180 stop:3818 length:639 start_codon:yes stop_codon:yes gene_type:complete
MHKTINNLNIIENILKEKVDVLPNIIAVSKTFPVNEILPLIKHGHRHFGENKIQEALDKWSEIKNDNIKLHLVGKLQSNKTKFALKIFDYIHSLDSEKLANKIANEQAKQNRRPKLFIQINIGGEEQKSGIKKEDINKFYKYCKNLDLDIIGTMCIPPKNDNYQRYFLQMNKINKGLGLVDLSMGMSEDYLVAAQNNATFLRIGSKIFGQRD